MRIKPKLKDWLLCFSIAINIFLIIYYPIMFVCLYDYILMNDKKLYADQGIFIKSGKENCVGMDRDIINTIEKENLNVRNKKDNPIKEQI